MNTVELLELALAAVKRLGYRVRIDALEGAGGVCQFKGRKWLFLDLAQKPIEHLHQVLEVLRQEPAAHAEYPPELQRLLTNRRAA